MKSQKSSEYTLKKDRYSKSRGGNSHFLNIYCSHCKTFLVLYQKDGQGKLLRLYLDRIFAPQKLADLQDTATNKKGVPNLTCAKCGSIVATPMVYAKENRLAFRLITGKTIKKQADGESPPIGNQKKEIQGD